MGLSAITVAELEYGARHVGRYDAEKATVGRLTAPFELYAFDAVACPEVYGEIRHSLESRGLTIEAHDLFIAAHALALEATLVTNNAVPFSRIPRLKHVNWAAA